MSGSRCWRSRLSPIAASRWYGLASGCGAWVARVSHAPAADAKSRQLYANLCLIGLLLCLPVVGVGRRGRAGREPTAIVRDHRQVFFVVLGQPPEVSSLIPRARPQRHGVGGPLIQRCQQMVVVLVEFLHDLDDR